MPDNKQVLHFAGIRLLCTHTAPQMCAPHLLPPQRAPARHVRGPEQLEQLAWLSRLGTCCCCAECPHLCSGGWKMCALQVAGDEPSVPPSHRPMAVTWLLDVVCLQQECSRPCSLRPCVRCGALELVTRCRQDPSFSPLLRRRLPQDLAMASM